MCMLMYVTCGVGDASARDIDKAMKLGAGMCCVCDVCKCSHAWMCIMWFVCAPWPHANVCIML